MCIDIALVVAARNTALEPGLLQMAARSIDAVLGDGRNGAVGPPGGGLGPADFDDAADPGVLQLAWLDVGDVVRVPVDAVHDYGEIVAKLVGEIFVEDAAGDWRCRRPLMDAEVHRIALQTIGREAFLHGADDVATRAQLAQGRFQPLVQLPDAGRMLGGEAHAPELGQAAQAKAALELPLRLSRFMAQVEEPPIGFLGHRAVDARETILIDLGGELSGLLDLADGAEFQRRQFGGTLPNTVDDVVAVDDQILPQIVLAPEDDMHMGMAGVVVIDRDPIEPRAEVGFHPAHEVAGIGREVREFRTVLGRDDEAELVAVVLAAIEEGVAIGAIIGGGIELAALAVAGRAVTLDVAQMGLCLPVLTGVENVALLDHDAPRARLTMMPTAAEIAGAHEDRAAAALHALAAGQDCPCADGNCGLERRRSETDAP